MGIRDEKCQQAQGVLGFDIVKCISLCLIILAFGLTSVVEAQGVSTSQAAQCAVSTVDENEAVLNNLSESELEIIADSIRLNEEILNLIGNVTLKDHLRTIKSDHVTFDRKNHVINAEGHVSVIQSDSRYSGENFRIDTKRDAVSSNSVRFLLYSSERVTNGDRAVMVRGNSENLLLENGIWELGQSSVTHCPEGVDDVVINASEVELNTNTRQGKARNVTAKIKNVPLFYSPYIGFPLGAERLSGFLFPTLGYRSRDGAIIEVPYYFNLAPNYDATISTNILSKRGLQLQGEFRHLGVFSDTTMRGEILHKDKIHPNRENRYAAHVESNWFDGSKLYSRLDSRWISDRKYKDEFAGFFSEYDNQYLRQDVEAGVFGDQFKVSAGVNRYIIASELVDDSDRTHERFPWASYEHLFQLSDEFSIDMGLYADRFRHPSKLSATRYRTDTAIEYLYDPSFGNMKIRVGGEKINYRSFSNVKSDGQQNISDNNYSSNLSISSEYFEADGRLFFDREFLTGDSRELWTIEPRIKIVSSPKKRQQNFPVFDTTVRTIDVYDDLFQSTPYIGGDRVRNVKQVSTGVSFSLKGPSGYQSIRKFGVGRIFYSRNRVPILDTEGSTAEPSLSGTDKSDIFLGANIIEPRWRIDYGMLYDDNTDLVDQATVRLSHKYSEDSTIGSVYRFKRDDNEQIGALFDTQLNSGWRAKFLLIESLKKHQLIKSEIQLHYASCCLNIGFRVIRELDDKNKFNNSYKFFIKIDGFGIN